MDPMQEEPFPHQRYNRRWYDQIGNMAMAVHVSRKLPPEIQLLIARSLSEAIDEHRQARRTDNDFSIGLNRALGMYKSSNRQRWYDPQPQLHRAFTQMTGVPDALIADFAERILDVNEYVSSYLGKRTVRIPDPYHLAQTVETILQKTYVELEEDPQGIRVVSNGLDLSPDDGVIRQRHIVPNTPRSQKRPSPRHR